jgi:hypothetical protein
MDEVRSVHQLAVPTAMSPRGPRTGLRRTEGIQGMAVTSFQDFELADRDREWDGQAAEKRVRAWARANDGPNEDYRKAHL